MPRQTDFKTLLKAEFEKRKSRNSSYSLRAFAQFLHLSPASLSQILSGKRPLTAKAAMKVADRLGLSPYEKQALIESTFTRNDEKNFPNPQELLENEFRCIADWYHFAILSLSELPASKSDPRWIASQLGITVPEARDAIDRMLKLNLIKIENSKIHQLIRPVRTTTDIPSQAIRIYHAQNLDQAKLKLETVPVELREFSTITMSVARNKLPRAKKMITQFKRQLSALLEDGERDAVYTLAIQLFPVSKLEKS